MSYTKQFSLSQGSWTLLIDQQPTGFVQLKGDGPVLLYVGASALGASSEDAMELDDKGIRAFTFTALEATDKVYGRSRHDETCTVVAVAPGTAPA